MGLGAANSLVSESLNIYADKEDKADTVEVLGKDMKIIPRGKAKDSAKSKFRINLN